MFGVAFEKNYAISFRIFNKNYLEHKIRILIHPYKEFGNSLVNEIGLS